MLTVSMSSEILFFSIITSFSFSLFGERDKKKRFLGGYHCWIVYFSNNNNNEKKEEEEEEGKKK